MTKIISALQQATDSMRSFPATTRQLKSGGIWPVRIMHVLDRLDVGGTELALLKLIGALEPELFEHYVCTLRGVSATAEKWTSGLTLVNGGRAGASFQFNVPRLVTIMRKIRPAIVHSRNWGGIEGIVAARVARVPVALHSEHGYELNMSSGLPFHRRLLRHCAYRAGDAVATVTEELRDYHANQAWWKAEDIRVLYNGVDGQVFRPQPQIRAALRRRLAIPDEALVIGSVGRMVPLKDFVTLLQAAETLMPDVENLHVVLVGAGPELAALRKYVDNSPPLSGHVAFTGATDEIGELLNAMDIFVLPSLMEGMSNTLLEAMAVGLPVIATRVGGNPEVLAEGRCGYLFTPQDVTELAALLRILANNRQLRKNFGCAARERAVGVFSLSSMVKRYRDLYVDLLMQQQKAVTG